MMVPHNLPSVALIRERLALIFPEGTEHRNYLVRDVAAHTVYVALYVGAVESADGWIRPNQVTRMTDEQAEKVDEASRHQWAADSLRKAKKADHPGGAWYAVDSRESIRDETIKEGFLPVRAMVLRTGIATTSDLPRYALQADFAALFDPKLTSEALATAIEAWQNSHLSKAARTRQLLVSKGAASAGSISVKFPNGEVRSLSAGPSSPIAKAVIEVFAPRFLRRPAVLWLSESGNKVVARDDELAKLLGINIDPSKALPDIILVDLGDDATGKDLLVVFAEVVATDGPITRQRKVMLTTLALEAGFDEKHLAFLSAFLDRAGQPFKKAIPNLAWGSYAWFASEPDYLIELREGTARRLSVLPDEAP